MGEICRCGEGYKKFACINFILYIFYPRKIFREHLYALARRMELSLPPKPSLLVFCSTLTGSTPPLARPRQKIEFGSALYAVNARRIYLFHDEPYVREHEETKGTEWTEKREEGGERERGRVSE